MTVDGGALRVVLLCRVSTKDQTDRYSLRQQENALRRFAGDRGYKVVGVVSGQEPNDTIEPDDRPNLFAALQMVRDGVADAVLAQDADRIVRDPWFRGMIDWKFEQAGGRIRALDDPDDGNPQTAELVKFIQGWSAKTEKQEFKKRSKRNRLQRAREGKVLPTRYVPYGFLYEDDTYVPDPATAPHARKLFELMALDGLGVHAVSRWFRGSGVPTPGGSGVWEWAPSTIKRIVESDLYLSRPYDEVAGMVETDAARGRLEPGKRYGVCWFNRSTSEKRGRKKVRLGEKGRDDWIAVPVADLGIPPEWVRMARARLPRKERAAPSSGRYWFLRGVVKCHCGRYLQPKTSKRGHYYVCGLVRAMGIKRAGHGRYWRADELERSVREFVLDLVREPEHLKEQVRAEIARRLADDPTPQIQDLTGRLNDLAAQRDRYNRRYAAGKLAEADLDRYLGEIDDAAQAYRAEIGRLTTVRDRADEMREWADAMTALVPHLILTPERKPGYDHLFQESVVDRDRDGNPVPGETYAGDPDDDTWIDYDAWNRLIRKQAIDRLGLIGTLQDDGAMRVEWLGGADVLRTRSWTSPGSMQSPPAS
jgi:DNA invertase Pin-like site-specific DNA recombinase